MSPLTATADCPLTGNEDAAWVQGQDGRGSMKPILLLRKQQRKTLEKQGS